MAEPPDIVSAANGGGGRGGTTASNLESPLPEQRSCGDFTAMMNPPTGGPWRVCVLTSSYENSTSATKDFDIDATPGHYFPADSTEARFELVHISKPTTYSEVRALIKSEQYDVFFNLCDGAKDEDRAGEEVVRTLEEFHAPFTGATSKFYELSKPQMKMMAHYSRIRTARFAVVDDPNAVAIRAACQRLNFPVIVKHPSGYASVGMTRKSKCLTMADLEVSAAEFVRKYKSALVEEFIAGDEATVLACADPSQPDGVRVFHPVIMTFPPGEDFKHFELKWVNYEGMAWHPMDAADPALPQILDIGRRAFKSMMGGIGYGRSDIRIDRTTGHVYFLEINPNCGIMYPPGQEGSADWILRLEGANGHRDFTMMQIRSAYSRMASIRPKFNVAFDDVKGYFMRAATDIPRGCLIFQDEGRPFRLFTRQNVEQTWDDDSREWFSQSAWPLSTDKHVYAVWDVDPGQWRPFNHSCAPNMQFVGSTLNVAASRDIRKGEELTMDYATFCDDAMKPFVCHCGAANCRSWFHVEGHQTPPVLAGGGSPPPPGGLPAMPPPLALPLLAKWQTSSALGSAAGVPSPSVVASALGDSASSASSVPSGSGGGAASPQKRVSCWMTRA